MPIGHYKTTFWRILPNPILWASLLVALFCPFLLNTGWANTLSDRELTRFRQYFALLQGGGSIDAVLDRSTWPHDDGLASYLELELLLHPSYKATLPRLMNFLQRWPNHAQRGRIERMVEVRIAHAAGENEVLAWYDRHHPVTKAGRVYYLQQLLANNRMAEAEPLWRDLYLEGVSFPQDLIAKTAIFERKLIATDREERARNLISQGHSEPLKNFLKTFPIHRSDYFLALDAATRGDKKLFTKYHARLSQQDANSPELWHARFEWLRKTKSWSSLSKMLMGREGRYLSTDDRCLLRYRLARVLYDDNRFNDVMTLLYQNVQEKGAQLEDSAWLAAWSAYRLKNHERALELFTLLGREAKSDHRRSQGAWWAAELSKSRETKQMWINQAAQSPDSFYGLIALEARDGHLPALREPDILCHSTTDPRMQQDLHRMLQLRKVERAHYNGPEIDDLSQRYHLSPEERLCLATHTGAYDYALKLSQTIKGDGRPHYWSALYPTPHWQPDQGWSLDPALVWGIARQESTFLPHAESNAHAVGLLQLMPATAAEVAKREKLPPSNPNRLRNPTYNLALGQSYMKRMLNLFDGDLVLALASYNAGPGRGKDWRQRRSIEPTLAFIENIPFTETRNYVKRVITGVVYYQLRLYGKGSILSLIDPGEPGPGKLTM
ncbi:MAG: lytic transglycosylase domain-containing protein [Magnetococcus sp. THC-1_WYH]